MTVDSTELRRERNRTATKNVDGADQPNFVRRATALLASPLRGCAGVVKRAQRRLQRPRRGSERMQVMAELVPRVGVGVLVCRGDHVLVGKRRSSVGGGKYALPGGFLDFGESWEECAAREVMEETGLAIHNMKFAHVTNTVMRDERRPSHSVTIFMRSDLTNPDAEPENLEPDKCEGWRWVKWPNVPQPQFQPLQSLIASNYKISG